MPSIVEVLASITAAPIPITLQGSGAIVSQGATTLSPGADALLTQDSDLTPLLAAPLALASLSWSGGTVIATTVAAIPGLNPGDSFRVAVSGASPSGYNGSFRASVTGANTFTYPLAVNPGTSTAAGSYSPPNQVELQAMVTTFFAEGTTQSVYVLELGAGDASTGPEALGAWIALNPGEFYGYLVPGLWDASVGFLALVEDFLTPTSKTYFWVRSTLATYAAYTPLMKAVFWQLDTPGIPTSEVDVAASFQHALAYAPSSANRVTPFAFTYLYGVTPYPTQGNNAILTAVLAANGNYVGTGAEGGISTAVLFNGTTADGEDFTYWYSVDWIQLQANQALANAVINGSNNPLNPLYYNQFGINTLQDVVVATVQNAISYGLANGSVARAATDPVSFQQAVNAGTYAGQCVVNAVPFLTYTAANPNDYRAGKYAGLQVVYITQSGFKQIVFNLQVSQFLTS
jgi:hypothetical protein